MTDVPTDLAERLLAHGQGHVLAGWDALPHERRAALAAQLEDVDLPTLAELYARRDEPADVPAPERIAPMVPEPEQASADAVRAGEDALRAGKVGVVVVAGGQGTRLGFDKPKGMFPVAPLTGKTLFALHAEKVLALSRRYGKPVPLLVMTSPATHAETVAYFAQDKNFGLPDADVRFFQQGTMPALELESGRLILEGPGSLFLGPNGHGGTLTALADSGLLDAMTARGVEHLFYFQVDNPLVRVADPAFVGRHVLASAEVSVKSIEKEFPKEKMGVFVRLDGRCAIIEYSDLPDTLAELRDPGGRLTHRAGNPAIHLFAVPFLKRITRGAGGLPYHLARKKVPVFDSATGQTSAPKSENALKFEMFIFDALPLAERWLVVETDRRYEFGPLKNADGPDSPATVKQGLTDVHARWLEAAGVSVPRDGKGHCTTPVEIAATFALDADELRAKLPSGFALPAEGCILG